MQGGWGWRWGINSRNLVCLDSRSSLTENKSEIKNKIPPKFIGHYSFQENVESECFNPKLLEVNVSDNLYVKLIGYTCMARACELTDMYTYRWTIGRTRNTYREVFVSYVPVQLCYYKRILNMLV